MGIVRGSNPRVVVSVARSEHPVGTHEKVQRINDRKLYRWCMLEDFVLLSQVFVEFENRRDVATTG